MRLAFPGPGHNKIDVQLELTTKTYREAVEAVPFGKRLPTACYIHIDGISELPILLKKVIEHLQDANSLHDYNLVKLFRRELKLSFLCYPAFNTEAHPALAHSLTIDLSTGKKRAITYKGRSNPPILHRKETFLPENDSRIKMFARLTREEEALGLLEDRAKIGFEKNWLRILEGKGVEIRGHRICEVSQASEQELDREAQRIPRHLTAIQRSELSKPVKALLTAQILTPNSSFFDYGCGLGDDLRGLELLGYKVAGWDPHFAPKTTQTKSAVVNLGFVLNVIEDPAERIDVLQKAWALTETVLCISVLVAGQENYRQAKPLGDGLLTKRGTFQKYFDQSELLGMIEQCLDTDPIPISLGVCLAFRDTKDEQDFLSKRTRRAIDWESVSRNLRSLRPSKLKLATYERNPELLEEFWQILLTLGRCPKPGEYEREDEIRSLCKSLRKAADLFVEKYGPEQLALAAQRRKEDLMVYLSAGEFQKRRPAFTRLSKRLKTDIKCFFGDYKAACAQARDLLFASGDPGELELAIENLDFGWVDQEEGQYSFHRSSITDLPPILRIYIECAARRYGNPEEADIIKIHIHSGKLTFLHYHEFESDPFPQLLLRIKIDLRNFFVTVFDHSLEKPYQILFFKERFLPKNTARRKSMEQVSNRLRKFGIDETTLGPNDRFAPSKEVFEEALKAAGLNRALVKKSR